MEQRISVLSDVKNLSELVNGASVDRAHLMPHGGRLQLELELTRACPERQTVVRHGLLKRTKIPWVKSRLRLSQITDAAVQRDAEGGAAQAPLFSCEAILGGYQFVVMAPDGLRLQLTLDQLDGEFVDLGQPVDAP